MSKATEAKQDSERPAKRGILSALIIDHTPLVASRDYRLLFLGQFVAGFGQAISYVVLPWQMYQLTKSTLAVGMLGVAEFIPMFLMAFVGGALADYIDRRRLVLLAECGMAVACLILVSNALLTQPHSWLLFLIASLVAALGAIHRPAMESLKPRLVDPEHLPAVSALTSLN